MTPLYLIIGLLAGFYAKEVYTMLKTILEENKDFRESRQAGVVKPIRRPISNLQTDESSDTGGVNRPTPMQISIQNAKKQDEMLRRQ